MKKFVTSFVLGLALLVSPKFISAGDLPNEIQETETCILIKESVIRTPMMVFGTYTCPSRNTVYFCSMREIIIT
jgi:hypothetical protein